MEIIYASAIFLCARIFIISHFPFVGYIKRSMHTANYSVAVIVVAVLFFICVMPPEIVISNVMSKLSGIAFIAVAGTLFLFLLFFICPFHIVFNRFANNIDSHLIFKL